MHKAAARDKQHIDLQATGTGKKLVNLGIVGTTHNGIPLLFDEKLSANVAYFVNDGYMTLHVLKGVNMKIKKLLRRGIRTLPVAELCGKVSCAHGAITGHMRT